MGVDHDLGFPAYFGSVPPAKSRDRGGRRHDRPGQDPRLTDDDGDRDRVGAGREDGAADRWSRRTTSSRPTSRPSRRARPPRCGGCCAAWSPPAAARSLADVPGAPVIAKTGTAEYVAGNGELRTHAWMIAAQGDLAVAVFVQDGDSGSGTAGPILEAFLRAREVEVRGPSGPEPRTPGLTGHPGSRPVAGAPRTSTTGLNGSRGVTGGGDVLGHRLVVAEGAGEGAGAVAGRAEVGGVARPARSAGPRRWTSVRSSPTLSVPSTRARRDARSPITPPIWSSGTITSTRSNGSSIVTVVAWAASRSASAPADLEGHVGGVDAVGLAVGERDPQVDQRVAVAHAALHLRPHALLDARDELARYGAADDLVDELEPRRPRAAARR